MDIENLLISPLAYALQAVSDMTPEAGRKIDQVFEERRLDASTALNTLRPEQQSQS